MLESLRRFGLAHCDLPTMIENITFLLRLSSVNIEKKYTQRIPLVCYIVTILTGASYFYVFLASMIWFVFIRCPKTGDLVAATVVFSVTACSMSGVTTLIYMSIHNNTIKNIVDEFLIFDASLGRSTRFYTNLRKVLKYVKRRALIFSVNLLIICVVYIAIPIIQPGRHYVEDFMVLYGLEPKFETPNYETALTLMAAGICFGMPAASNTCVLITIVTGYAEALMLSLSEELNNQWDDAQAYYYKIKTNDNENEDDNRNKIVNDYIRNKLRDIFEKHKMCISLVGQVENTFRGAMTAQSLWVTSGLIAELLGGLENTYMQVPYTILQVAMNCFIGQRLIDASVILENAIYCCKWENFDKSNQRTVYVMLLNSQKTLTLSVGGMKVLSFTYLMFLLKSIYSAYTALRSKML